MRHRKTSPSITEALTTPYIYVTTLLMRRHIALYGSVQIVRDTCPNCKRPAFIQDRKFTCCDTQAPVELPTRTKRMSECDGSRRLPPLEQRKAVLAEQADRCFYCERLFGSVVWYQRRKRLLQVNWDHLVPHAYLNASPPANFVAACQLCNQAKGALIFNTIEEAKVHVQTEMERRSSQVPKLSRGVLPHAREAEVLHNEMQDG